MVGDVPKYYFRIRENGAAVFRIDSENRNRRIEMEEIASVNVRNGSVKPHGDRTLTGDEQDLIASWLGQRLATLAARDVEDIHRAIDHLNLTAQWVQSKATDEQLEAVADALLLAMHDLRSVLVRKKAHQLSRNQNGAAD